MATEDTATTDTKVKEPTPEERKQKAVMLGVTLEGLAALEGKVSSGVLPTQAAPVAPPPQPGPGAGAAYQFGRGIGVLAAPPTPVNQGRMYMGSALTPPQEQAFMQSAPGTRIVPPPPAPLPPDAQAALQGRMAAATGGESPAAALSRLQAADIPGGRTIAVNSEPPYSANSLANQHSMMIYDAMKKFDAGDKSPEVMSLILGNRGVIPQVKPPQSRDIAGVLYERNPTTGEWVQKTSPKAQPDAGKTLEAKSLYGQKATLQGQIVSPNTNPKKVAGLQTQLDAVNSRIKEILPSTGQSTAPDPVQAPATSASKKRVKVTGPNGKKGTIQEGDTLPDGWKLAR